MRAAKVNLCIVVASLLLLGLVHQVLCKENKTIAECREQCKDEPGEPRSICAEVNPKHKTYANAKSNGKPWYTHHRNRCEADCMGNKEAPMKKCTNSKRMTTKDPQQQHKKGHGQTDQ